MRLYEAVPLSPRAAVNVVQEAFGVNGHIEDITRRLAEKSYHAVAPDLFHRTGGGTVPYEALDQIPPLLQVLTDAGLLRDIDAVLDHLNGTGFGPQGVGIVGFCMGGRVTFLVALSRRVGAAVTFYGGGIVNTLLPGAPALVERANELQTPWLGLFGDLDAVIPVDGVERLRQSLGAVSTPWEIVRYPHADHGFHCDERPSYNADASADAWDRTQRWLDAHLPADVLAE
jgi:carboxymethylenebutenolidase